MAKKAATTKATAPVDEELEDDIEELDESEVAEAAASEEKPAKEKKAKKEKAKKEKPEIQGYTTRQVAEKLGVTPQRLRRILRSEDFFNDKGYTKYDLSDEDVERLAAAVAAGKENKVGRKKKADAPTEDAPSELDDLDELEEGDEEEAEAESEELDLGDSDDDSDDEEEDEDEDFEEDDDE